MRMSEPGSGKGQEKKKRDPQWRTCLWGHFIWSCWPESSPVYSLVTMLVLNTFNLHQWSNYTRSHPSVWATWKRYFLQHSHGWSHWRQLLSWPVNEVPMGNSCPWCRAMTERGKDLVSSNREVVVQAGGCWVTTAQASSANWVESGPVPTAAIWSPAADWFPPVNHLTWLYCQSHLTL